MNVQQSNPGGCTVYGVGLWPLDCWDRGIESRLCRGYSLLVFIVCCTRSGLCDVLIDRLFIRILPSVYVTDCVFNLETSK